MCEAADTTMKVRLPLLLISPIFLPSPPSLRSVVPTFAYAWLPYQSSLSVHRWFPNQLQMKSASPFDAYCQQTFRQIWFPLPDIGDWGRCGSQHISKQVSSSEYPGPVDGTALASLLGTGSSGSESQDLA